MLLDYENGYNPHENLCAARIKVVGVGGAGVNAVRRMTDSFIPGVELLGVNTDLHSLDRAEGVQTIAIGEHITRGLGAGGNPTIGREAAEETQERLRSHLDGADLVFIAAGMGGGTGTGAAPVVAALAKEAGAITVGIVTEPFGFEGSKRMSVAHEGMAPLRASIDTMVAVSNERLVDLVNRHTPMSEAFGMADQVIVQSIAAVSRAINVPGVVNVDFADVKAVLEHGGNGLMGIGRGYGERRVLRAAQDAMSNPLIDANPEGAQSVLFIVSGGVDVTLNEMSEAGAYISGFSHPNAEIFFGMQTGDLIEADSEIELIMIATRLPERGELDDEPEVIRRLRNTIPIYEADAELPSFLDRQLPSSGVDDLEDI
ncbi:cell division protein FtsZ [Dehalococcoidia bacterium]|nr:cell division protein FtsZ [Dehalococcoidia bacterium]